MADLAFEAVSKRYGERAIVDGFQLDVADGEFVVLVGGSGCGKSTTLRMVAGLESVTSGAIRLGGRDITHVAPRARDVAMVFQDYALYPHLTAYDNMALGLRLRKLAPADIDRRVRDAVAMLGLGELVERKPKQMSGGQRQRVAIGRAVVRSPAVYLFDEPLSNLDAHLRTQMRVEIHALQRRLGTTTIYVTHDQVEAMTLADRIVILDGGIIQQVGRPMELYRAPRNRFVAAFIGSPPMNFFEGRLEAAGDELVFVADGIRVAIPPGRRPASASSSREVTLGIRPQDLASAGSEDAASMRGTVALVERLGGATHLHVDVRGHRVVAAVDADHEMEAGGEVALSVAVDRTHLFGGDGASLIEVGPG